MARQRSYDQRELARRQQRRYEWQYRLQWIGVIVPFAAVLLALMSAILSWLPVPWLIVVVAFCSAVAQGIQAFIQMQLNPPERNPVDKLLRSMTPKQ